MKLRNSSFMVQNFIPSISLLTASIDAETESVNSVIAGFKDEWCQNVKSIGWKIKQEQAIESRNKALDINRNLMDASIWRFSADCD